MDTAIQRDFAGGRFTFYLPLTAILAVEKGPVTPSLRVREYPVSVFQIYDELSAGIGVDPDGKITRYPGSSIFAGDIHTILEQALRAGGSGERDGEDIAVDPTTANRLVNDTLGHNLEACALLAWDILHSTIKGVDVTPPKKKAAPRKPRSPRPSSEAK